MMRSRFLVQSVTVTGMALIPYCQTASAQVIEANATSALQPAAGIEVWASTDTESNDVLKVLGRALWDFEGKEKYVGIAAEHVWFSPSNGESRQDDRFYLDVADHLGTNWRWKARLGTDGDTLLGNAEFRRADWSRTFFFEREIVETDQGLAQKIYYTFAGASMDIPIDPANTLAVTTGVQEFSGKNERLHLRGRFSHVVKAEPGLSAQLDARYYHSTEPGEFDYFSPRDFIRILPLVQIRRFDNAGWMYLAVGGIGAQHSTGGNWQSARYAQLRLESPQSSHKLDVFLEITYSNDTISAGPNYDYLASRSGVTLRF